MCYLQPSSGLSRAQVLYKLYCGHEHREELHLLLCYAQPCGEYPYHSYPMYLAPLSFPLAQQMLGLQWRQFIQPEGKLAAGLATDRIR